MVGLWNYEGYSLDRADLKEVASVTILELSYTTTHSIVFFFTYFSFFSSQLGIINYNNILSMDSRANRSETISIHLQPREGSKRSA